MSAYTTPYQKKSWFTFSGAGLGAFVLIIIILYIFPIVYLFNVTFKTSEEFMNNPMGLASSIHFKNYTNVMQIGQKGGLFAEGGFVRGFFNSLLYTAVADVVTLFVTSLAAFVISRQYIKYSNALYVLFLSGIFLPGALIPQFYLIMNLGLYNNPIGYILLKINPGIVMLLMVGYYKTIPKTFDEAAGMEGCGTIQYILQILMPLSKPVIATGTILFSIGVWNDIIGSTIYLTSPRYYPIVRSLFRFVGEYGNDWPPLASAVFIVAGPLILLFAFTQRYIIEGVTAGGLKG